MNASRRGQIHGGVGRAVDVSRRQWLMASAAALVGCRRAPSLRVLVSSPRLEALPFWVALGARLFASEGVDVELVLAEEDGAAVPGLMAGRADLAVVRPAAGVELLARSFPFLYVANLLARDPACLLLHYARMPGVLPSSLRDRLALLQGLTLGVAIHDERRLEALFDEGGHRMRELVKIRRLGPNGHNVALASKRVDALYARSPHLEKSLLYSRAVLLVAPPRGEVEALDHLMAQTVLAHPDTARHRGRSLGAFVRALQRAADLCRQEQERAIAAWLEVQPDRNPTELAPAFELYSAALPEDLRPTPEAILRAAELYSAAAPMPDQDRVSQHTDPRFALAASAPERHTRRLAPPLAVVTAGAALGWWSRRKAE